MKATIEIDCTPAEARTFMGLPNVEPLQDEVMSEIQRRVMQALASTDPQQLLKTWAPWGAPSMELFQSFLRAASGGSSTSKTGEASKSKPRT